MLFEYYIKYTSEIPHYTQESGEQAVGDYIAGMTDVYAINEFKRILCRMPGANIESYKYFCRKSRPLVEC